MASIADSVPLPQKLGFDRGCLEQFEDKLFIEGLQVRRRLVNFFVLLLLATVIATYGVLSGSAATVIGAMLVAPLMGDPSWVPQGGRDRRSYPGTGAGEMQRVSTQPCFPK